jgi:hypothetical protein
MLFLFPFYFGNDFFFGEVSSSEESEPSWPSRGWVISVIQVEMFRIGQGTEDGGLEMRESKRIDRTDVDRNHESGRMLFSKASRFRQDSVM